MSCKDTRPGAGGELGSARQTEGAAVALKILSSAPGVLDEPRDDQDDDDSEEDPEQGVVLIIVGVLMGTRRRRCGHERADHLEYAAAQSHSVHTSPA